MKKSDLSSHVATRASLSRASADSVVDIVFTAIGDALAGGETVTIAGFGTFSARTRPARQGRHPKTGEPITIRASRRPSFKAAKALREALG